MLEQRPGFAITHRAHTGTHHLAVGQHNFQAADVVAVITCRTEAALQRIADHAAPAIAGDAQLQRDLVGLEVFPQIKEADAGLEDAITKLIVDFDDAVHTTHVEHHGARHARRRTSIAKVLAATDGPQRNAVFVSKFEQCLHLLY